MKLQALAAAAALLAAGSAGAASAQTAAPISIVNDNVFPASYGPRTYTGTADVTFVNESNQPATEVDLALVSHGSTLDTYRDVGSFAPGVAIHRAFGTNSDFRDLHVEVASVTFADGSTWTNDEAPLPRRQAGNASDAQ